MKIYILLCLAVTTPIFCTTYTVTNNNDSGPGSLRAAIINSNGDTAQPNFIDFNISGSATITLANISGPLPFITQTVTIDGTTQPGYSTSPAPIGTPAIVLNGSALTPADFLSGFFIQNTSNCMIKGITIQNFVGLNDSSSQFNAGVCITSNGVAQANNNQVLHCYIGTDATGTVSARNGNGGVNIVGTTPIGPDSGDCMNNIISNNLISGNTDGNGITLFQNVFSTIIQGNYIGTDITGTLVLPNGSGIAAFGTFEGDTEQVTDTMIGGTTLGQGNLISGNQYEIFLASNVYNTTIQGNLFGTTVSGDALLYNGATAIYLLGQEGAASETVTGTLIGGSTPGAGNVIGGYTSGAIVLQDNTSGNVISGNYVGVDATGTVSMPNDFGIYITGDPGYPSTQNTVTANLIKFNTTNGVIIDGGSGLTDATLNPILGNSIYLNGSDGIALLNNGNDTQVIPTLVSASGGGSMVEITATAPATPTSSFRLDFFLNSVNRNPITEGQTFIGSMVSVPSGVTVKQSFTLSTPTDPVGLWVSATATNLNGSGSTPGDTSPFTLNTIISAFTILPPDSAKARSKKNIFLGQTDLVNVVTWTAPSNGASPVNYQLYRDAGLTQLIASVPAAGALRYDDHNRRRGVTYSYYIVSVDDQGNTSTPISVSIVS